MIAESPPPATEPVPVPVRDVEGELARQLKGVQGMAEAPIQRARMSNLVIFCDREAQADAIAAEIPAILEVHPARVLLLIGEPGSEAGEVAASVRVQAHKVAGNRQLGSEEVILRARGRAVERLPFVVRGLLIGDLPTNIWWASQQPPPLAGALLFDLTEHAQQVVYDSIGWMEPARGVAATSTWLDKCERGLGQGRWRVASDLNWRRLRFWRRLLAQALAPTIAPGALDSTTEILIEHGPHAVIQAWELVSWLASRLGWKVKAGRVEPNVEISWQFETPHGPMRVRIDRLAEGPSEIRRVRVAYKHEGQARALNFRVENERRLAVAPEGFDAEPRTMSIQPQPLAELVGRQLSDRDRDPVFHESMAVAQVLAQSVLR